MVAKNIFDLHIDQKFNTEVHVDKQSAIVISHYQVFYGKTKHFNIKQFFFRDVQKKEK